MKKLLITFLLLLTLISIYGDIEYYTNNITGYSKEKGILKIISHTPSSSTINETPFTEITILFSKNILPIEDVKDLNVKFTIEPELKGHFRARGTSTIAFIADEDPDPSQKYIFTILKGILAIDSSVLKDDYTFTINPIRLKVLGHNLKYSQFPNDTSAFLTFNYDPGLNNIREFLTITDNNSRKEIPFIITQYKKKINYVYLNENEKKRAFTVRIDFNDTLNIECSYDLKFKNPQLMNSTYTYRFKTFNRFRYSGDVNIKNINYRSETGFNIYFSNNIKGTEGKKYIKFIDPIKKEEVKFPIRYGINYSSSSFYLYRELLPQQTYFIDINKNLKDIFGNRIENPGKYTVKTGDYYPFIKFDEYYIYNQEDIILNIEAMNRNFVDVFVDFMSVNDFIHFYSDNGYSNYLKPIKAFETKRFEFPALKNQIQSLDIDINNVYMGSGWLCRGFIRYYDYSSSYTDTIDLPFLFQQSSASMHLIMNTKNGLFFAFDRDEFKQITPGKIILFNEKGKQLSRFSLRNGLFEINKRNVGLFENNSHNAYFIYGIMKDDNVIMPYRFNRPISNIVSYVFTDRNLYTLNDSVLISGIMRNKDANRISMPDFKEIHYEIQGPDYDIVKKGKVFLDRNGTFSLKIMISDSFKTGYYNCYFDKNAYVSFTVQEFRAPKFETTISSKKSLYQKNEKLNIDLKGKYLSGQKMSNDSCNILFNPYISNFYSDKASGFNFSINNDTFYNDLPYDTVNAILNKDGEIKVLRKPKSKNIKSPISYTVTGTVLSIDKEAISQNTCLTYYPRNKYAGIKLSKSSQDSMIVEWTVISSKQEYVNDCAVKITLLSSDNYDFYDADTLINRKYINKTDIDTLKIDYNKSLYYKALLSYDNCNVESYLYSYYYGYDQNINSPYFITDKNVYDIGETASISIIPPEMEGRMLICWGTDSIYGYEIRELEKDTILLKIPIIDDFISGFYINTVLLSEDSTNDHTMNSHFVRVSNRTKEIECTISTDEEEYQPGDNVTITIKTDTKENVHAIVSVVDESILMLTNYSWYNPISQFHSSYSNTFNYFNTYNFTRDYYYKGRNGRFAMDGLAGGEYDMEEAAMPTKSAVMTKEKDKKQMSAPGTVDVPQIRSNFKKTVLYKNKIIIKNSNGVIKFKLPDNTTKFRISVILIKDDKFGYSSKNFIVSKKILLSHTLPSFLRPFDRFKLSFNILDDTGVEGDITAGIYKTDMSISSDKTKVQSPLNNKSEFRFDALSPFTDSLFVTMYAKKNDHSDYVKITIPVITKNLYEYFATFASTTDTANEIINIDKQIIKDGSEVSYSLNSSQIAQIRLPLKYLEDYQYLCLEQRMSRILPFLVGEEIINVYNLSSINGKKLRKYVNNVVSEIDEYQKQNGGFKYYKDSYYESEYLSIYAMYVLYHAKKQNYNVPQEMIDRGIQYLERIVYSQFSSVWAYSKYARNSLKCNAIYVLALFNKKDYSNELSKVFQDRDFLYISSKGRLLETLNMYDRKTETETLYSELLSSIRIEAVYAYFDDGRSDCWMFQNELKNSGVILKSLLAVKKDFEYADKVINFFAMRIKNGMWVNTHTTALVIEALHSYFKTFEKEYPNFDARVLLNNEQLMKEHFKGRNDKIKDGLISGYKLNEGKNFLQLIKTGQGRLFYTVRFKYARKGKIRPLYNGFEISKTFYDLSGKKVSEFERGGIYKVLVKIKSDKSRVFVTINDPLPAGFDIVKRNFVTEKINLTNQNYDKNRWGGFNHEEFYMDRAIASAIYLSKGKHEYSYYVRAIVSGTFTMPPTNVFEMYTPEVFGHSGSVFIEIK